jgi:D-tyrosyl-tRNA(Tyr) deacylase
MRVVVQRVRSASVWVVEEPSAEAVEPTGREVARIGTGLAVLVGFAAQERPEGGVRLIDRLLKLRVFDDANGRLNRSLPDVTGELLLVPQVTLTASLDKGHRPSFHTAAAPETARVLFEQLLQTARARYAKVAAGIFQARMMLRVEHDGPVTLVLDVV